MIKRAYLAVFALLLSTPAHAERTYALAMTGAPRYPATFKNLDYVNPAAPKSGTLALAKTGTFNSLNYNIVLGLNAEGLELVNDKLMQRTWNEPFTLYGLVAESIDISPDRSKITFFLNKKARFHDGHPMTADDVKFSYEALRKNGLPVRRRIYGLVKDVKIINPHEIKFTFGVGYDRESAMILAMMPVLPKHYWEKHDISKTTLEPPLGSGPYKIDSVDAGRKITYTRVKDYWAKDLPLNRGLYNFDKITYTYYRDDTIALESFKAGEYNVRREYDIKKWMTGYDFKDLKEGTVVKEKIPHQRPEWLRAFIFNTRRPMFQDKRVREALSLMFNYDWINKNLYYSAYKTTDSIFANSELSAAVPTTSTRDMRINQKRAIALLKEAGWSFENGMLISADKKPFEFEILCGDPAEEKLALEFTRSLKKIGIRARVRTVDSAQFSGRLDGFEYDMVSYRWINTLSPGNEQVGYWGSKSADTRGSRNYSGLKNAKVDSLASSIAVSKDRASLVQSCRALDHEVMSEHVFIPLFYSGFDMIAYNKNLHKPAQIPQYGVTLETFWEEKQETKN